MGTINYQTSEVITLGTAPEDFEYVKNDFCEANDVSPDEVNDSLIYDIISEDTLCQEIEANFLIDNYTFYWFRVNTKPGYYEGVQIIIEHELPEEFEIAGDKKDFLAECDTLQKLLLELHGIGFSVCHPWWCTTYEDYSTGRESIKNAIAELKTRATAVAVCA